MARLLVGLDVFLVGCTAIWPRSTPGTRPGDCRIGEGQSHVETDLIHTFGPYDFEVDTTNAIASAVAKSVLAAWRTRNRERGLWQGN